MSHIRVFDHKLQEFEKLQSDIEKRNRVFSARKDILSLPHPKRTELSRLAEVKDAVQPGIDKFTSWFIENIDGSTDELEWLVLNDPQLEGLRKNAFTGEKIDRENLSLGILAIYKRWADQKSPIMTIDPELYDMLDETDIADSLPVECFNLPFRSLFMEFPLTTELRMQSMEFGEQLFEGLYIAEVNRTMPSSIDDFLGIKDIDDSRHFQIFLTGRPLDADMNPVGGYMEGDGFYMDLVVPNKSSLTMNQLIEQHTKYYEMIGQLNDDMKQYYQLIDPVMKKMTKMLLFMNSVHYRQEFQKPESEAKEHESKIKSPGKQKKYKRKTQSLYDKIFVTASPELKKGFSEAGKSVQKKTHKRRGHLRRQPYGPKNDPKYKILFIPPTTINPKVHVDTPVKSYGMKV